jgi:hypothetical protein
MNLDYRIVILTDNPHNFDKLEETLEGQWKAHLVNMTTNDKWHKEGGTPEASLTAPVEMKVVEGKQQPRVVTTPLESCGPLMPAGHMVFDPSCGACREANANYPEPG